MFRFLQRFHRSSQAKRTRTGRARSFRLAIELLEGRLVPSTISAVSWQSMGVTHHALYSIGSDDTVSVNVDGGAATSLGGYVKQLSAGLDAAGNPELYAIGYAEDLYVNNGTGWVGLGGYIKRISATAKGTVYAIGKDNSVYVNVGGSGFVGLGGYALDISAGLDANGNPEVYAIGSNHGLYVNNVNRGGGFVGLGGYVKQISATVNDTVYAILSDDSAGVFHVGANNDPGLGGYYKEISAGLDANGKPELFAIGADNRLEGNADTINGFVGGYVRDIAAPAIGVGVPGDVVYGIGANHAGLLYKRSPGIISEGSYTDLGGYIQVTTAPGATISAITWVDQSFAGTHSALYAIGKDDAAYVNVDGGGYTRLGGYLKQISAGLDVHGYPELYGIGLNDAVYSYRGGIWVELPDGGRGGYAKQISATVDSTVYAIGKDNAVYVYFDDYAYSFTPLTLRFYALQISAGRANQDRGIQAPEVYAIGKDNGLYVYSVRLPAIADFVALGGYVKQISATMKGTVYAIGGDDAAYVNVNGGGFVRLGGYVKEISAGLDSKGKAEFFAIGSDDSLLVNNGGGYVSLGGYVRDIAAPRVEVFLVESTVGLPVDLVYAIGPDHEGYFNERGIYSLLGSYIQG